MKDELFEVTDMAGDGKGQEFYFRGELATLELKPGDVFVLHSETQLSGAMIDRLTAMLKERFPGHEAIFVDAGMTLGVLRKTTEGKSDESATS